jgi:hypothetical protein
MPARGKSVLFKPFEPQSPLVEGCRDPALTKRSFTIDNGKEKIEVEGHEHKNVAVKYLMKRRRSLLSTKDPAKVEVLFAELPSTISVIGKQLTRSYRVSWEKTGTGEFAGARFTFTMDEA